MKAKDSLMVRIRRAEKGEWCGLGRKGLTKEDSVIQNAMVGDPYEAWYAHCRDARLMSRRTMPYGEEVAEARKDLGFTQVRLAGLLDVDQSTIAKAENGTKPGRKLAKRIEDLLGVKYRD